MAKVLKKAGSILKAVVDIILPPVCYICRRSCSSKYGLCDLCLERIHNVPSPYCLKCGKRLLGRESICSECNGKDIHYIEKGWSCCYYKDTVKECVHLFKYRRHLGLVDIFRDIMLDFIKKNDMAKDIDLIVPVPMHPAKRRERTYNHAEIIARSLSKHLDMPFNFKGLKKIKWTESQSELDRAKRLQNVKDTFLVVDKNAFFGKRVLLVDDVYTTGATINECAKAVQNAEPNKVFFLTLARGL